MKQNGQYQGHHVRLEPHLRPAGTGRAPARRVLNVKSDRPQYWKAETLDGFDGFRWIRTNDLNDTRYGTQVAYTDSEDLKGVGLRRVQPRLGQAHPRDGALAVHAVRDRRGRDPAGGRRCGTPQRRRHHAGIGNERLEKGDTYSVRAYAPNPTRKQMQGAPKGYIANLARYTAIRLPHPRRVGDHERPGRPSRSARPPRARASRSSSRSVTATRATGARAPTGSCAGRSTRRCTTRRSS